MHPYRTRFAKEIVAEFYPPLTRKKPKEDRVIIFCRGFHSAPSSKSSILEFWAKKGYWVIVFRYRGTWESGGRLLRHSHEEEVLNIVDQLPRGFVTIPEHKRFAVRPKTIYVFGVSFGGTAALLASRDSRVTKVVAISPVVDWRTQKTGDHSMKKSYQLTREGFGDAYRFSDRDWKKLEAGKFYNPAAEASQMDGKKILMIHAKDDDVVGFHPGARFAKQIGAKLITLKHGGHGSSSWFTRPSFVKKILTFLRKR